MKPGDSVKPYQAFQSPLAKTVRPRRGLRQARPSLPESPEQDSPAQERTRASAAKPSGVPRARQSGPGEDSDKRSQAFQSPQSKTVRPRRGLGQAQPSLPVSSSQDSPAQEGTLSSPAKPFRVPRARPSGPEGDSGKPGQAFQSPLTFLPSFSQDIPPTPQTALPIFLDLEDLVILQVAATFGAYAAAGIEVTAAGGAMLILFLCHPGFLLSDRYSFLLLSAPGGAETALGSYLICGKGWRIRIRRGAACPDRDCGPPLSNVSAGRSWLSSALFRRGPEGWALR